MSGRLGVSWLPGCRRWAWPGWAERAGRAAGAGPPSPREELHLSPRRGVRAMRPHLREAVLCRQRAASPRARYPRQKENLSPGRSGALASLEALALWGHPRASPRLSRARLRNAQMDTRRTHGRFSSKDKKSSTGRKRVEDALRALQNPESEEWF